MPRKGEYENLSGRVFDRLKVLEFAGIEKRRRTMWWCECKCGKLVKVDGTHLKNGHTKSCGCLNNEKIRMVNYKNGLSGTKLHYAYCNMCNRCNREDNCEYSDYGGRGIKVCDEWLGENGFVNFADWSLLHGYKEGLTIDRINNNKGYSPDNCRWVDRYVQANNKRNTRYLKINGEVDTVANLARKYNVSYWNLLHYSKGGKNFKYPDLIIEMAEKGSDFE